MKAVAFTIEKILFYVYQQSGKKWVSDRSTSFVEEEKLKDLLFSDKKRTQLARWKAYGILETLLLGRYRPSI